MITIRQTDWQHEKNALSTIRQAVFINEQQVPVEDEWDNHDDNAIHWVAENTHGHAIGCVRLLANGHIGRLAVLKEYRNKHCGQRLLKAAMNYAENALDLLEVFLSAQCHALAFYQQQGFNAEGEIFLEAGIEHKTMRKRFAKPRILGKHSGKFVIHDYPATAYQLISQCKRELRILNCRLDASVFDNDALCAAISRLARLSRYSAIKLLITEPQALNKTHHRLIALQQRLSSSILLRQIEPSSDIDENLIIADDCGFIVQSHRDLNNLWGDFNNVPSTKVKREQFENLWYRSKEATELRILRL